MTPSQYIIMNNTVCENSQFLACVDACNSRLTISNTLINYTKICYTGNILHKV